MIESNSQSGGRWSSVLLSDPTRGQTRHIHIDTTVSIANLGVAVFECDEYSIYSDADCVAELIHLALSAWQSTSLALSIHPSPHLLPIKYEFPSSWSVLVREAKTLRIEITKLCLGEFTAFFDSIADREEWTFALPNNSEMNGVELGNLSIRFPDSLVELRWWNFLLSVDLDGMLIGFIRLGSQFEEFKRLLQQSE